MRKIGVAVLLLVYGCHLGPRYEVPCSSIPEDWKGEAENGERPAVEYWWEVFEDPCLVELEKRLVADNPDLYSSLQRIAEARALAGIEKADLFPQASLQPSYNDTGELIELYGVPAGLFPGLKKIVRVHEMSYALPLNMNYEVDIWQKYRGKYNSAAINIEARQEAYRATLLMLTSELASNYYNARTLDSQILLLAQMVHDYHEMLRLRQLRYLAGLDNYLDVLQAIEQFENSEAEYEAALQQRMIFENAIAALIGLPASDFKLNSQELAENIPVVPAGIPSTLLTRRPDVAEAERYMAASHALIGVAYATFFPQLNLTGALGFLSPELSKFITWAGYLWEWGAQIFQTVFDGGRRCSLVDGAKAIFEDTVGRYQKAVLTAFKEVENALNNLEQEAKQAEDYLRAFESAEMRASLVERRFEVGTSNQLDVLTNEIAKLQAEQKWIGVVGLQFQATIQLIKAIGGKWDCGSLELAPEEKCRCAQGEEGDQAHRPDVVQNDGDGEIFQEASPGNDEKIP